MRIERIEPDTREWLLYYGNHISRYSFARQHIDIIKDKRILDIACGVGYGSKYLSEIPDAEIIGVDRSKDALSIAKERFKSLNITFVEDDCLDPRKLDSFNNFDIIVSFETLEHVKDPAKFLRICFDKLSDEGTFFVSTPNASVSSPNGIVTCEHHEKEYKADEFVELLSNAGFEVIKLYGQELNEMGVLKSEMRVFINHIYSNWFIRLGHLIRGLVRPKVANFTLPEHETDFTIKEYEPEEIIGKAIMGPFVLIAVCRKGPK
jgi:SAM-dependent methyltransferase